MFPSFKNDGVTILPEPVYNLSERARILTTEKRSLEKLSSQQALKCVEHLTTSVQITENIKVIDACKTSRHFAILPSQKLNKSENQGVEGEQEMTSRVPAPPQVNSKHRPAQSPAARFFKHTGRKCSKRANIFPKKTIESKQYTLSGNNSRRFPGSLNGATLSPRALQQYSGFLNVHLDENKLTRKKQSKMNLLQAAEPILSRPNHSVNPLVANDAIDEDTLHKIATVAQHRFGIFDPVVPVNNNVDSQTIKLPGKVTEKLERQHTTKCGKNRQKRKKGARKNKTANASSIKMISSQSKATLETIKTIVQGGILHDKANTQCLEGNRDVRTTFRIERNVATSSGHDEKKTPVSSRQSGRKPENSSTSLSTAGSTESYSPIKKILRALHPFNNISRFPDNYIEAICHQGQTRAHTKGDIICPKAKGSGVLYIIKEGAVHVHIGKEKHLLDDGCVFGLNSILYKNDDEEQVFVVSSAKLLSWTLSRLDYQIIMSDLSARSSHIKSTFPMSGIHILAGFPDSVREALDAASELLALEPGGLLVNENAPFEGAYFVKEGKLVLTHQDRSSSQTDKIIGQYNPGDHVGLAEIFSTAELCSSVGKVLAPDGAVVQYISKEYLLNIPGLDVYSLKEFSSFYSKIECLSRVQFLQGLSILELSELAANAKLEFFKSNKRIIREGDIGKSMFIIKHGEVKFLKSRRGWNDNIGHLFTNEFFGEGSVLTSKTRRASALALTKTICLELPACDVKRFFGDSLQQILGKTFLLRQQADMCFDPSSIEYRNLSGIRVLGSGSFGKVMLVRDRVTGKTYAMKEIQKRNVVHEHDGIRVKQELAILSCFQYHPFICNLIRTYKTPKCVYFMMEAVLGGELFAHLRICGKLPSKECRFYTAQIVSALEYLHSHEVIFRDLKPENVLISKSGYLKLVDFGLSKIVANGQLTYTMCGTPTHLAPEVYSGKGHDAGVDWWSLGVLVHELLTGYVPFMGSSAETIYSEIMRYSQIHPNVTMPSHLSNAEIALILGLMNPSARKRLGSSSVKDIMNHSFFGEMYSWVDLLKGVIQPKYIPFVADVYDTTNFHSEDEKTSGLLSPDFHSKKITEDPSWCMDF
jgi:CRP-like cAMP-binding protein/tRNA A-37 threonylcarbamoyl transferase component Bud32